MSHPQRCGCDDHLSVEILRISQCALYFALDTPSTLDLLHHDVDVHTFVDVHTLSTLALPPALAPYRQQHRRAACRSLEAAARSLRSAAGIVDVSARLRKIRLLRNSLAIFAKAELLRNRSVLCSCYPSRDVSRLGRLSRLNRAAAAWFIVQRSR